MSTILQIIDSKFCGKIIGVKGENIKQLESKYNIKCKLILFCRSFYIAEITGNITNFAKICTELATIIFDNCDNFKIILLIRNDYIKYIIGKNGKTLKKITDLTKCNISIDYNIFKYKNNEYKKVIISSNESDEELFPDYESCVQQILDASNYGLNISYKDIYVLISPENVGMIIGKDGRTINHIKSNSIAKISMLDDYQDYNTNDKVFKITGTLFQIKSALNFIFDILEKKNIYIYSIIVNKRTIKGSRSYLNKMIEC